MPSAEPVAVADDEEAAMEVVIVTGAGSGMGRACVEAVRDLADVVLAVDLRAPDVDGATGVGCDVSDPGAVAGLAARVSEEGSFRALVHAAGISPTMGDARRIFEVNLVGTQLLLDAFDPLVVEGSAAVAFASSSAYQVAPYVNDDQEAILRDPLADGFLDRATEAASGDPGFAYALSKVGVIRAAGRAAVAWGRRGGRVNSISPGIIDTPMGRQELEQQPIMREMLAQVPLDRLGRAEEVAAVARFLVSEAASFVSGIDVLVDGGYARAAEVAER